MKRHYSAAEISLNIIRGGIIIAIIVTIVCFYTNNSNTSTIVISSNSLASAANDLPSVSSASHDTVSTKPSSESRSDSSGLININTATAEQLTSLKGIGEVKAAAIVEYRREHGNFSCADDLLNVNGIGEKTLENIRNQITV